MFDLEKYIADWRKQMLAAGIKSPVPLEELEIHLREEIERQVTAGMDARHAFEAAVAQMGEAGVIRREFNKDGTTMERIMKKTIVMIAALLGNALGVGLILPALARWRQAGILDWGPILAGCALAIACSCAVIHGVRTHREARGRRLIGIFIIAAATFYVIPLIQSFFQPKTDLETWIVCVVLAAVSISFYGGCLYQLWRSRAPAGS